MMDIIKTLDSVFNVLSLEISSNDDILKYEQSYSKLRESIQQEIWEEDEKQQTKVVVHGVPFEYEPKRRNRFVLTFPDFVEIPSWSVASVRLPKYEQSISGRTFSDLHVELHDLVGPSTAMGVYNRLTEPRNYPMVFTQLDPTGFVVQTYTISVTHLKKIENSTFNQEADDLSYINLAFSVNNMIVT